MAVMRMNSNENSQRKFSVNGHGNATSVFLHKFPLPLKIDPQVVMDCYEEVNEHYHGHFVGLSIQITYKLILITTIYYHLPNMLYRKCKNMNHYQLPMHKRWVPC